MNYSKQLENIIDKALYKLCDLIQKKGEESGFVAGKCFKIKEGNYRYNLYDGRYLVEITQQDLIDNSGYTYDYTTLEAKQLLSLIDHIISINS